MPVEKTDSLIQSDLVNLEYTNPDIDANLSEHAVVTLIHMCPVNPGDSKSGK